MKEFVGEHFSHIPGSFFFEFGLLGACFSRDEFQKRKFHGDIRLGKPSRIRKDIRIRVRTEIYTKPTKAKEECILSISFGKSHIRFKW